MERFHHSSLGVVGSGLICTVSCAGVFLSTPFGYAKILLRDFPLKEVEFRDETKLWGQLSLDNGARRVFLFLH